MIFDSHMCIPKYQGSPEGGMIETDTLLNQVKTDTMVKGIKDHPIS